MAAEKAAFDASKFEQKRDEIFEMEKKAEWKVAKICQHSAAYRKSDNSSVFKASLSSRYTDCSIMIAIFFSCSLSETWLVFLKMIVS